MPFAGGAFLPSPQPPQPPPAIVSSNLTRSLIYRSHPGECINPLETLHDLRINNACLNACQMLFVTQLPLSPQLWGSNVNGNIETVFAP